MTAGRPGRRGSRGSRGRAAATLFALALAALAGIPGSPGRAGAQGAVAGQVRDADDDTPVAGALVAVEGTTLTTQSGAAGRFAVAGLPPGEYVLLVRRIGYRAARIGPLRVADGSTITVRADLTPAPPPLDTVVIQSTGRDDEPSAPAMMAPAAVLSADDIASGPSIAPDAFRAAARVPGVSSGDLSAGFRVRGGPNREVLLAFDGVELYEPFHLKDFDGALSIIDPQVVGTATLSTGGFGARYGNHVTGVFDLASPRDIPARATGAVDAGVGGVSAVVETPLENGRADWLASARRGFLGAALGLAGGSRGLAPSYWDAYARLRVRPRAGGQVAFSALHAGDGMIYTVPGQPTLSSDYASTYEWLTWDASPSSRASARSVVSVASLDWTRTGALDDDGTQALSVAYRRRFTAVGVRQDWTLALGEHLRLDAGAELRRVAAAYDYARRQVRARVVSGQWVRSDDSAAASPTRGGTAVGAYLSSELRPTANLTLTAGARYDRASWAPGRSLDPRVALRYALGERTTIHAAWGRYSQVQELYEMQVPDGAEAFAPPERAEHRVVGIEHRVGDDIALRVEAYDRRLLYLAPGWVSLEPSFTAFPEVGDDRVRIDPSSGDARGVELSASSTGGRVEWSASYALAAAREVLDGRSVPVPFDQRHSLALGAGVGLGEHWRVNADWQYHSGWPATPIEFVVDTLADGTHHVRATYGAYNTIRVGSYNRLDVRVTNRRRLGSSELSLYLDVFNVLDRANPRGLGYVVSDWNAAQANVTPEPRTQLPRLPTVGARWTF